MALRAAACAGLALAALPLCCRSLSVQTAEAELSHGHGHSRGHKHVYAPTHEDTGQHYLKGQGGAWTPLTEEQRNASLKVWLEDYSQSSEWVDKLKVHPAKETDRVAVTILQPATPEKVKLMAHIIKINMHRLGPKWGLAVYYCQESEKQALSNALGNPQNIVWAPIFLRGERISELGRVQFSYYLLSMDFWDQIPTAMEHVLIFGDDSIVLRGDGCIDQYTSYDYVGAPWHWALRNMPRFGGNGGFRLVKRSSSIACLSAPLISKMKAVGPGRQRVHEDEAFVQLIHSINGSFPDRDTARGFAVETVMHPSPCAVHKPWLYQDEEKMRKLLSAADPP